MNLNLNNNDLHKKDSNEIIYQYEDGWGINFTTSFIKWTDYSLEESKLINDGDRIILLPSGIVINKEKMLQTGCFENKKIRVKPHKIND
jgi:hypothetical protein